MITARRGQILFSFNSNSNLGKRRFFQPPAEYFRPIAQWYGFHRETDDADAKREPEKIADALFRFRDRPQSSEFPRKLRVVPPGRARR